MKTSTTSARIVQMTAAEYHSDRMRVSRSMKVDFLASPWLYYMRHVVRDSDWQQDATPDMVFGTIFHAIALEGETYESQVKIIPEHVLSASGERRGNDYTKWAAIHPDASEWLRPKDTEEQRRTVDCMLRSLRASQAAAPELTKQPHPILTGRDPHEVPIHWTHCGIECRTLIDRLNCDSIIDLKTVRCADLHTINNTLEDAGYYLQAADYQMAVEALTEEKLPFTFIFVEKAQPFRTVVVRMDQDWVDAGRDELTQGAKRLQQCADSGDWHDPIADAPIPMSRPQWAKYKWQLIEE